MLQKKTKGQMGLLYVAVGVLVSVIALIMLQQVWFGATNNGTGGNFTGGSIALLVVNFVPVLVAIGVLVAIVASAIGMRR
jgi:hypothetical protein